MGLMLFALLLFHPQIKDLGELFPKATHPGKKMKKFLILCPGFHFTLQFKY